MKIVEYDQVDPQRVFELTVLALGFQLTAEHAAHIRSTDPRPFPFLSVIAVEGDLAIGHVGVFRLPLVTSEGAEDMGGVWAVSTHPQYSGQGVASRLLDEAHARMRAAGLRFSTLGTDRWRGSHRLYQRHGYADLGVWGTAQAGWGTARGTARGAAHRPAGWQAEPGGLGGYERVEALFAQIAPDYLGFTRRSAPFARLRDTVSLEDIWILREGESGSEAGYALARVNRDILHISNLVLRPEAEAAGAVAALAERLQAAYVLVTVTRPAEIDSLQRAGFRVAHPDWAAFMLKPLLPEVTVEDARRLLGVGTDRFLISWLDTT